MSKAPPLDFKLEIRKIVDDAKLRLKKIETEAVAKLREINQPRKGKVTISRTIIR